MKDMFKFNIKKNKSLTYMLPLINQISELKFQQFILNSYLTYDGTDDTFCLMYKWSSDPSFLKYEEEIKKHPLYIKHEDFGEKVVYKFALTEELKECRRKFIKGEYKQFSEAHKKAIVDYMEMRGYKNTYRIKRILDVNGDLESTPPEKVNETLMDNITKVKVKVDAFV